MENAKRDENRTTVALVVTDEVDSTIVPLKVDPISGRLLVTLVSPSGGYVGGQTHIPRDSNKVPSVALVDSNGVVRPLLVDPVNGAVLCSITAG